MEGNVLTGTEQTLAIMMRYMPMIIMTVITGAIGVIFMFLKSMVTRVVRNIDARLEAMEAAGLARDERIREREALHDEEMRALTAQCVRREDYVREITGLHTKMDQIIAALLPKRRG